MYIISCVLNYKTVCTTRRVSVGYSVVQVGDVAWPAAREPRAVHAAAKDEGDEDLAPEPQPR